MLSAFTVDVEDYYQVSSFERDIPRTSWGDHESRVVASTQRMLDLLSRHSVRGTFFVLGWVAERFPQLVNDIVAGGHELASHSYWHRLIYDMTPGEFRDDLRRSLRVLEDIAGAPVKMFRAPSFSITRRSLWALKILAEEGIEIDSSIFPTRHDRYGIADAEPGIHIRHANAGDLVEFPPTVVSVGGVQLPIAGGGYFRFYPLYWTMRGMRRVQAGDRPVMFYVHPWEIDPHQPRLRAGTFASRLRHRVNLRSTYAKLDRLLATFSFGTVSDVLARHSPPEIRQRPRAAATIES